MPFPLMSRNPRPESDGRDEKPKARLSQFYHDQSINIQNKFNSTSGVDLGRTAAAPQIIREARMNRILSIHMSEKKIDSGIFFRSLKYPITIAKNIGRIVFEKFQWASRTQVFFD